MFVCANEESNSSSNEPETSVSGLVETGALLTTISERPPNYTNTIVVTLRGTYTSDHISEGQSSQEVTSTKPVKAVEKVKATLRPTIDGNLSSFTGNEEHSSLTTEQQVNNENTIKTKSTFETFNSQSVSYGEVTPTATYSMAYETETTATDRSLSSTTGNEEGHTHMTTEQQENSESVNKTSGRKSSIQSLSSQSVGHHGEVTTTALYTTVDKTESITTDRNLSSVTGNEEEHFSMTTERQENSESVNKTSEKKGMIESLSSQSVGNYGEVTTHAAYTMVDETNNVTTERNLSSVTGNSEHSSMTTERQDNSETVSKTVERNSTIESLVSQSVSYGEVTTTAAYTMDGSNVTRITSEQSNQTSRQETSMNKEVTERMTRATSESEEDQANTSDVSQGFTAQTSLPHSQSTTIPFTTEDLRTPANITSVNVTNSSVTLQWCQVGMAHNFSVTVKQVKSDDKQLNTEPRCSREILNETIITNWESCNGTWMSYVIPDPLNPGVTYNSTIRVCVLDRCENASYTFQTAPADPREISFVKIDTQSVNVSWVQKEVANNFDISVSDPSARVCWNYNKTREHVWGSIDRLSTPGQLLTITITALNGQSRSNSWTKNFNTKPSKPGSLVMFDCLDNSLCIQWNQLGIFDSCVIKVNGSEANVSCWNSSDTTENQTTVNCTVHHTFPSGSYTTLSVAVKSGRETSDGKTGDYVKKPAKPEGLRVEIANTSTVCFSWNQTDCYDEFDIRISLPNHIYQENRTFNPKNNVACMYSSDVLMWCVDDLPCPGAVYSLHVATASHGKRSDFQSLTFRPAVDYVVTCGSKTNESFEFSIQPHMKNDACPSFEDVERIEYSYHPVNNESCSNPVENSTVFKNTVLNGARNTTVTGLIAGVTYQVTVWAVIDSIKSKEQVINCTTKPNPPSGLRTSNVLSTTKTTLYWTPEGCIADFLVQCIGQNNAANYSKSVKEANVMCENLTPGALYNVTVSSRLRDNTGIAPSASLLFVTVPMSPRKVSVKENLINSLELSVQLSDENNTNGQCTHFHFKGNGIKETTNPCENQTHNLTQLKSNTFYNISISTISNYSGYNVESQTSVDSEFVSSWTLPQAVSNLSVTSTTVDSLTLKWIQPDDNISEIQGYNLMIDNCSKCQQNITLNCSSTVLNCTKIAMTYELKNLTPSTNYTITIWAFNRGGGSDKKVIMVQTQDLPVYVLTAALIGIIAGAFVIFILTVFILIVLLRKKTKFAVPSARRPSDGLGFQNPTFTPDLCENMKPKPIPLDNFIEYLDELHSDSDLRFSAEYALLTELSPKLPQTTAEIEENRTKNRYSNILPFDHSRVKLIPLDDDDQGSDYINASYMPGYVSKREFIAAQGPMKSTVDDFWRMIWEQHISTIVMVTNLQERGREKCAEYWPTDEEPLFYGDLQVQMKSESQLNYYIIRILDVKLGEKKRVVKHLHFISWPDFGCPENTAVLLDFVLGVRAHAPSQPLQGSGPILVHCSAGVGRTGTFILVDHLLQRMRGHKTLDIFGLVLDMRNYRCNMLQTEAQYVFAHECIKTAIERQMISSFRNSTIEEEDEECMYQNVDRKDKLQEEEECVYQNCKNNVDGAPV